MSYVTHANAPLTPEGRLKLAQLVINEGWVQARVAERLQASRATVSKWVARFQAEGSAGLLDRSSRPRATLPNRKTSTRNGGSVITYGCLNRRCRKCSSATRYRLLGHIDLNTGLTVRKPKPKPIRYERENLSDLVHVDVKKLGRIPDGGGHRTLGRQAGNRTGHPGVGHSFLHSAVDDHSR